MALIKQSSESITDLSEMVGESSFSLDEFDRQIRSGNLDEIRLALNTIADEGKKTFDSRRVEILSVAKTNHSQEISDIAFRLIENHLDESMIMTLLSLLESESAYLRNQAIELLQNASGLLAPHIMDLLEHQDPDVRIFAIDILGMLPHEKVPEWLEFVLSHDAHVNVIGAAVDRVTQLSEPSLLPSVAAAKERFKDVPYIKFACDIAIKRLST